MGGCNEGAQDPPTDMLVYYLWVAQNLNRCCIGGREVGCTSSGVCGRVVGRCIGGQGGGAQVVE